MFHEKNIKIFVYVITTIFLMTMIYQAYQNILVLYRYHQINARTFLYYGTMAAIILTTATVMVMAYKPTFKTFQLMALPIALIVFLQWAFVLMSDSSLFYISIAGTTLYLIYYLYMVFGKKLSHPVSNFRFNATSFAMPVAFIINIEYQGNFNNVYLMPAEFFGYMALFFAYATIIGASFNHYSLPPHRPHEKKAIYDEILYKRRNTINE